MFMAQTLIPPLMRALVYRGANQIAVETVPVPSIAADEILVKVAVCGVCPTDIKKIQYGTVAPPRIFGHEIAGTIVKVGDKVDEYSPGDRVALHHHVPCLKCRSCLHRAFAQCPSYKKTGVTAGFEPSGGGFAEFVRVMPFVFPGIVRIPDRNDFEEAAMLEPVNTVLKGIRRLNLIGGDKILVAGQGPIGLIFTRLLRRAGFEVVATDLLESRLSLAREWGACLALSASGQGLGEALGSFTEGQGLDAAVLAVPSNEALNSAFRSLRGGGQILLFAHTKRSDLTPIDLSRVCVDEMDLLGSYSSDFTLQAEVADLVFSGQLDVKRLISSRFGLEDAVAAIRLASQPAEGTLKVVVSPED
jgi:L-iditol 2-dehydrogenase